MSDFTPLAASMRPKRLADYVGQPHLLAPGKPLYQAIEGGQLHSMILWGPPGCGKTTLAKLLTKNADAEFYAISAVLSGVKDIREIVEKSKTDLKPTVLFVDEVHRFNKCQQDAFLPHVEEGVITFIGATTENPSFALNNALLSRSRVYVLKALTEADLLSLLALTLKDSINGLGKVPIAMADDVKKMLVNSCDGDARTMLNILQQLADLLPSDAPKVVTAEMLSNVLQHNLRRFDKQGDYFYDQISALHKSVRGSDPDAALYWFARMIDGGCDPLYIARRVVRMASEDIGNADPRALQLALEAYQVQERLGSPEGELSLAQAIVYLAVAAKSNAVYKAYNAALAIVKSTASLSVPLHLRNAPTKLMKSLEYGKAYRYAHDEEHAYAAGENYFPEGLEKSQFYFPTSRGLEIKIKEKLATLKKMDTEKSR